MSEVSEVSGKKVNKERAILEALVRVINTGQNVAIEEDWGGNTLTIYKGDLHSHCGQLHGSFDDLVDDLYELLCRGKGLSWE